MKIAIDNQIFCLQRYGGVSRYFIELTNAVNSLNGDVTAQIFSPIHFNAYLAKYDATKSLYLKKTTNITSLNRFTRNMSTTLANKSIKKFSPDLIHETFYSNRDLWEFKAPRVLTVFDLVREKQSLQSEKSKRKKLSILRSDHIICISENTKNELTEIYGVSSDRISVVYLGVRDEFFKKPTLTRRRNILFVGQRADYKDFNTLLKSFSRIKRQFPEYKLVCFGGGKFTKQEFELMITLGLNEGSVTNLQGDDELLINLYQQSALFVSTSIDEGFGLPLLEALASGLKVICSDIPVYREIAGKLPTYFEPRNVDQLTESIILNMKDFNSTSPQLFEEGRKHAKNFTWGACAEKTIQVYIRTIED